MEKSVKKTALSGIFLGLIVAGAAGLTVGNVLAFDRYYAVISSHLAPNGDKDSAEANAARNMGNQLAKEIEREGIVMLKNEDNILPLPKAGNEKVNVFGYGSVEWFLMSSGSEMVGCEGQTPYDFVDALNEYGIQANTELLDFYKSWNTPKKGSVDNTIFTAEDSFYVIKEPSLETNDNYKTIYENAKSYSDTAFFIISRCAGENSDPPHYQNKKGGLAKDETRGYLEISKEEEYALTKIGKDFKNVIVLINSTNTMTLSFLDTIEGIDACLNCGVTGVQGAISVPQVIFGDYSPSGHMTDTVPYKPEYNVAYYRGNAFHTRYYEGGSSYKMMGSGGSAFYQQSCYVEYAEGIYVGYRWFETADKEGFWDNEPYNGYENVVQFPFGYGMSYTKFDWTFIEADKPEMSEITNKDKITLKVEVENKGSVAGKDVVEVYLTAPYTPGEVEKAYVKLVAYAKTPELTPGQKCVLDIEVDCANFKSFDDYDRNKDGHAGYEMDAGEYELKLQTDAHTKKEMNQNSIKYKVSSTLYIDEDEVTGVKVEPRFTGETAYLGVPIDGSSVDQGVEYIHRNNFPALLTDVEPNKPWTDKLKERYVNGEKVVVDNATWNAKLGELWDNATTDYFGNAVNGSLPSWGSTSTSHKLIENGTLTEYGMKCAADYDAPEWDELLNQIPFSQAKEIVTMDTNYQACGIAAIGLREDTKGTFQHAEGASQVGNGHMAPGTSCVGYPSSTVLAQTWNQTLAYMFGKSEGNDMGPAGKDALYSPATNIHRTNYGGRNSGYQSEDPYLAGRVVGNVIKGLGAYGKTTFMKHFVLNDQDFNRMALYTWTTEQALREIYLRTFEEGVKYGDSTGIMTSFNRCGGIWAGGNEALIQGVLRGEWGFRGQIITDMTENKTNMDVTFHFRNGGNVALGGGWGSGVSMTLDQSSSPARVQWRLRECMHEIAYSYSHALYKNAVYNESADPQDAIIVTEPKRSYQWWEPALVTVDAFAYGGLLIGLFAVLYKGFGLFHFAPNKEEA